MDPTETNQVGAVQAAYRAVMKPLRSAVDATRSGACNTSDESAMAAYKKACHDYCTAYDQCLPIRMRYMAGELTDAEVVAQLKAFAQPNS